MPSITENHPSLPPLPPLQARKEQSKISYAKNPKGTTYEQSEGGKRSAPSGLVRRESGMEPPIDPQIETFSLLKTTAKEARLQAAALCGINADQVQDAFPCTPLQEGLLAWTARRPGYYIVRYVLELRASVNWSELQATWRHVVATEPILRTRIVDLPGQGFVQVIVNEPFAWTSGDSLDKYIEMDEQRQTGLGTRLAQFGMIDDCTRKQRFFVWTMHHSLYDCASVALLLQKVNKTYLGEHPQPPPPFQGFIKQVAEMDVPQAETVWRQHFDGLEALSYPPLPSRAHEPKADKTNTHFIKLLPWSDKSDTMQAMIWAAWAVLLGQYVGTDEALFGVTTPGRQARVTRIESLTCPTMTTIPFRTRLDKSVTVTQYLQYVREEASKIAAFEQLGMQRIRHLSADSELACQFQTLLDVNLLNEHLNSTDGPFEPSSLEHVSASDTPKNAPFFSTFALKIQCKSVADGLDCLFTYDSNVLSTPEVRRLGHQFEHVLRLLLDPANATTRLCDVDLICLQDLEDIWTWNASVPQKVEACVHDLISETARRQPDAPALCAWDGSLMYGELDRMSTQLAHYLVSLGVGRNVIVPLCFEKSMWTSVAIQGVMKAGGTCVTMDSNQPEAHLRRVTQQISAKIILSSTTNKARAERLVDGDSIVVVPESVLAQPVATPPSACLPKVRPSDNVYIVFTSGSTGLPKGAIITHSNFCSAIFHQQRPLCMTSSDRVFDYVSYAFDVSWLNGLLTLAVGACLCTPSEEERQGDIAVSIRRFGVTYADLTPSITRLINPSDVPSLQHLTFGGEEVLAEDVYRWRNLRDVVNAYGPAECTPKSMAYNYITETSKKANEIGRGIGLNCWVTQPDDTNKLAIVGSVGELWHEGPLVGAGYLHEPEKTAAAYIENPPWLMRDGRGGPGRRGRLYKTGDLVRYNPDGSIVYIKRKDTQVKIRGQRVEMAEIEHHVRSAFSTNDHEFSVVAEMILPKGGNYKILTAFVTVLGNDEEARQSALISVIHQATERLKEQVPAYMIPGAYVALARMPMGATGKTDRRRLRDMGGSMTLEELSMINNAERKGNRRAPNTDVERRLLAAWETTLGIDANNISTDDSFLRIGGDSLSAMRLVTTARQQQGLLLTVADIFKKPVLADLATTVSEIRPTESDQGNDILPFSLLRTPADVAEIRIRAATACGVESTQVQDCFPCTPLQEGLLALTARRAGDYVPQFVMALRRSTDSKSFCEAWEQVVAATPILRTYIIELPGQGLTQVVIDHKIQWNTHRGDINEYLREDQRIAVGLGTPLVRYGLITDRTRKQSFFVWTIHHALYDGWSMRAVLQNVQKAYRGETLPPSVPFQAFVQYINTEGSENRMARLWQDELSGLEAEPWPPLPSMAFQPRAIEKMTYRLDGLRWPSTDITASTAVRAALSVMIMQYTSTSEALFGLSTIGRQANMPGIEDVAGPTLATIPIRASTRQSDTVEKFLYRIQEQSLNLTTIEQLGLQRIRRISNKAERACQFQTLLVVQPRYQSDTEGELFDANSSSDVTDNVNSAFNTYALMIECTLDDSEVSCDIAYDGRVLDAAQVQRICYSLEHILRQLCAPEHTTELLADLDFVSPQDLKSIWTWNAIVPETVEMCMHDLIAGTVVRRTPEAPAICAWDGWLSYKELDLLSTRLARHLVTQGVGRGVVVPLCFEKSMWTSVAILGVMKAGGASVTLDTTVPVERLRSIVSQCTSPLILASASKVDLAGRLLSEQRQHIIVVNQTSLQNVSSVVETPPLPIVDPGDMLYSVFTSGSTGTPKGTIVTHRSFCSAIKHQALALGYSPELRTYNFVSHSFDALWHDVLRTFAAGGCLCVPSESDRMNDIAGSFERLGANSLSIPPSAARLIDPKSIPSLRHLIMGGEPVTATDVARWKGQGTDIFNVYGPAECVPPVAVLRCDSASVDDPSLGRGRGVHIWLVDPANHDKLSPIGSVGEAVVEGPLVGEGYLGNESLSKQTFLRDPAWLVRGHSTLRGRTSRLYKTGDLMKYNEDGTLVFVARKDAQVKINSQRFELAEVEQHIRNAIDVQCDIQLVVEVIKPGNGKRPVLVAFLSVPSTSSTPPEIIAELQAMKAGWKDQLAKKIPAYMIPSAYIPLEHIPMTSTGKTDRRKLREIGSSLTMETLGNLNGERQERREPTTKTEHHMRELWTSILGIDATTISIDDSFLKIGGDSVLAMRLVGAAREQGLSLTVANIFQHPVLKDLALVTGNEDTPEAEQEVAPFSLLNTENSIGEMRSQAAAMCGVAAAQVLDAFPCTSLQAGLLALTTVRHAGDYVARNIFQLRRSVDKKLFSNAWNRMVATTPILRTRIVDLPERQTLLTQVILDEKVTLTTDTDLDRYLRADRKHKMGLGTPLVRCGLIDDGKQCFFVWTLHHALYDGWSMPLLMQRLKNIYHGDTIPPSPPLQSFVKHILEINKESAEGFWREYLAGHESKTFPALPTANYRPRSDSSLSHSMKRLQWPLDSGITASTMVRTAWAILAARYTGATEAVFGATVSGRQVSVPGIEKIMGPTINTVPVRIVIDGQQDQTLGELLHQVQSQAVHSTAAEQLGLQQIRQISDDAARACDFQTLLVIQPPDQDMDDKDGLFDACTLDSSDAVDAFNTYGMQILCFLAIDGATFKFSFDSHLIQSGHLQRTGQQLEHLLRQMCVPEKLAQSIGQIETVSEQDLADIWKWNAHTPPAIQTCVHELIAKKALQQPAAPAICAWDGKLTYGELHELSTRLAHRLVSLGVKRNTLVPLCFEKSLWTPVAQLAVMKAGAASVVLDVSQPAGRLRTIVGQTHPVIILCSSSQRELSSKLSMRPMTAVVTVDKNTFGDIGPDQELSMSLPTVSPSDRLYVVFTSGSTGTPKGAIVTHSNFSSAVQYQQSAMLIDSSSRVYDFVSYAFDVSWANVLHTLTAGGCLCVPSNEGRRTRIVESMQSLQINYAHLTPTIARLIDPLAAVAAGLRTLQLSGEALLASDRERWSPHVTLLNTYGPAECSVTATLEKMTQESTGAPRIGKGLGVNTWVVELHENSQNNIEQLAPIGSIGELVLEGPTVGCGYLADGAKTAASFIQDPSWLLRGGPNSSGRPGRIYRTGDLVRYDSQGKLIFVGRRDGSQVKIRGQRVELGDIEYHIAQCLANKMDTNSRAVVDVITPHRSEDPILVAFLEIENADNIDPRTLIHSIGARLAGELAKVLPSYVIANAYVPLTIPMTATGKTDRRRLREIGSSMTLEDFAALNTATNGDRRQPTTNTEHRLQALWASVLRIDPSFIGLDDNFLRLGGDSVAAMRLAWTAQKEGLSLSVGDIFKEPVLCDLAKAVEEAEMSTLEQDIEPFALVATNEHERKEVQSKIANLCRVEAAKVQDAFPCTPLQEGLLALTTRRSGDWIAQYTLTLRSSIPTKYFKEVWSNVVAATPILRTHIVDLPGKGLVQAVLDEAVNWTMSNDLTSYLHADKQRETGLGTPLARYGIVHDGEHRVFVWTMHHALYDGWSMKLLMDRVRNAFVGGQLLQPPPLQSFVKHIADMNKGAKQAWREYLDGLEAEPFPTLPEFNYQPMTDQTMVHTIDDLAWPSRGITGSSIIRAAWSIVIAHYTNADDALFGITTSGRQANVSGVAEMIGPTISTIPVRISVSQHREDTVTQFLQRVQQQSIDMTPVEQVGLQHIRRFSKDTERACQFQTLLDVHLDEKEYDTLDGPFESSSASQASREAINASFSTFLLQLLCNIRDDGLNCEISFDSKVLSTKQIHRMAHQFEHVLRQFCDLEKASVKLSDVDFTSPHDLEKIYAWNATLHNTMGVCVHDLISEKAQRQPIAPAVHAWDGELLYKELDDISTCLARYLVTRGVGSETIVPLYFEKSMWTPVVMLAVMKAGGASISLDTNLPQERLRSIIKQTEPILILSSPTQRDRVVELIGNPTAVFFVDRTSLASLEGGETNWQRGEESCRLPTVSPANRLYVVFTSGSTGIPKGAVITHENFSSAIHYQQSSLRITASSRVYDFVSYAFDVTWSNVLHTFAAGGCLCIPSEQQRQDEASIMESMRRFRVNYAHLTPTVARLLNPSALPDLQTMLLIGEPLTQSDRTQWAPYVTLINTYGPAECTVASTVEEIVHGSQDVPRIGRGVGLNTWIVNSDATRLVPIGGIGELVLEGPLVGSGYLGQAEKASQAFIENPPWLLQAGRHGRLYKTGDLVRYDEDGSLTFVGRAEGTQVKIRGQRVELGDIAHHIIQSLGGTDNIQVVAEIVTPQGSNKSTLVAFLQSEKADDIKPITSGLLGRLAKSLPPYMIPSACIPIPRLPMTASGKTDRRRLREIGNAMTLEQLTELNPTRGERCAPETLIEQRLQALWATTLQLDPTLIGRNDNFLQIGGDSIAAMRLVSTAREHGLRFTVADVFKQPELCDLATVVTETFTVESYQDKEPFSLLADLVQPKEREALREQIAALCGVHPLQVSDAYPCTPLQEGLLALTARRSDDYVSRAIFSLRPSVDWRLFQNALDRVVVNTAILRTRIVDLGLAGQGLTQAVIDEPIHWTISEDLNDYLVTDQKLSTGLGLLLTRYGLIRDRRRKQRFFVWTIHHALYDGWSIPLIMQAIKTAYYSEQQLLPSPPFRIMAKYVAGIDKAASKKYWSEYLDGLEAQPFPPLPAVDYSPQADTVCSHVVGDLEWPRSGVTAPTMVRAAWAILAAQFTGVNDVVFGATVSGRQTPVPKIEQIVGPTIATVPVRVIIDPDQDLGELLHQLQRQAAETTAAEQLGIPQIRQISTETARACEFQTLIVIEPVAQEKKFDDADLFDNYDVGNEGVAAHDGIDAFTTYGLSIRCNITRTGAQFQFSFDSRVIELTDVRAIGQQLEHVLRQVCTTTNMSKKLDQIEIINESDLCDIWTWNSTVPETRDVCVHDLISERVRRQPTSPAVCAWDGELCYAELDRLSTQLARHLAGLGVGCNDKGENVIVPLCFEKSVWTPVAKLAVMKAGGASVVMDTKQPQGRLQAIVDQTKRIVILCSAGRKDLASRLAQGVPVLIVDRPHLAGLEIEQLPELPIVNPSTTLYVVFTSGSTGTPKGAMISHRNFSSATHHQQTALQIKSTSRVYDFVSYAFDVTWSNILHTLTAGGCLCIPSEEDRENRIPESMHELRVNYAHLTPTVARLLKPSDLPGLQTLLLIGEPLTEQDRAQWAPHLMLINTYGPAECSVTSTWETIIQEQDGNKPPRIGRGVGLNTWVVSPSGEQRLVPICGVGELVLEGPLIGSGYLSDPGNTAAAFIENPSWLLQGGGPCHSGRRGRLYRTGDLVRYDRQGALTYVGRRDTQVKIRGQRVDLGDIEHHIRQNMVGDTKPQVVAEVLTPQQSKQPVLVVFIESSRAVDVATAELRVLVEQLTDGLNERLAGIIPAYMIPSAYVPIGKIPTTASGKTDRRRLQQVGSAMTFEDMAAFNPARSEWRAPITTTERRLQGLWASTLGIKDAATIGLDDNFLQIGGDSISAMRLVRAARDEGMSLTIANIFKQPLLKDMAATMTTSQVQPAHGKTNGIDPSSDVEFVSPILTSEAVLLLQDINVRPSDVLPVTNFQQLCIKGALSNPKTWWDYRYIDFDADTNITRLTRLCHILWRQFDALRTVFISSNGHFLQAVPQESEPDIVIRHTNDATNEDFERMCKEDEMAPTKLGTCFTRFFITTSSLGPTRLTLRLSHAQYDGMSAHIIMQSLVAAYDGQEMPNTPMFTDFIRHGIKHSAASFEHWQSVLQDSTMTEIPSSSPVRDKLGMGVEVTTVAPIPVSTDGDTTATTFTAACACALAKVAKTSDVTFGRVVSGRSSLDNQLEQVVGACVEFMPVRVRFDGDYSLKAAQRAVQAQYIDGMAYETIGLGNFAHNIPRDQELAVTDFGCVTRFQNVDERPAEQIGQSNYQMGTYHRREVRVEVKDTCVQITAWPRGEGLEITASSPGHARFELEDLLRVICEAMVSAH